MGTEFSVVKMQLQNLYFANIMDKESSYLMRMTTFSERVSDMKSSPNFYITYLIALFDKRIDKINI